MFKFRKTQRAIAQRRRLNPLCEVLESRQLLAGPTTYLVNSIGDAGVGSGNTGDLRYAITQANANSNPAGSQIQFDPTVFSTPQTITVATPLDLNNQAGPVTITGPGANLLTISGGNTTQVFNITNQSSADDVISDLTIANGMAVTNAIEGLYANGGGISFSGGLTINDAVITHNTEQGGNGGGGIYNVYAGINISGTLTINNSVISDNSVITNNTPPGPGGQGGGIDVVGIPTTITNTTISGNTAGIGGGIEDSQGNMTITDSTISGNSTLGGGFGGGIDNSSGTVSLLGSTISGNASFSGAGINNNGNVQMTIINSTIADNDASYLGGGILNDNISLSIRDSTIASNTAMYGGGIYAYNPFNLYNSIVELNTNGSNADDIYADVSTAAPTASYNLIGVANGPSGLVNGVNNNQVGVSNPGLGVLANNGGPTQTIALLPGSPAIDAGNIALAVDANGNPLLTDQVGNPRTSNGTVDLGAVEFQSASQAPTITTNPTNQTVTAGQSATFTAAASGNPAPTVQWQVSTDGGNTFSNIANATGTTLSVPTSPAQNGNEYQAVFSNSVGTVTTTPATLTVDYAPTITSSPTNTTVNAGQTVTFSASASDGNPTPTTVQWQVNTGSGFTNLSNTGAYSGVTTDTLTITGVPAGLNGAQYQAVFSNAAGLSATTTPATLTVKVASPTAVKITPSVSTSVFGQPVTFTATVTAAPPATGTPTGSVTFLDGSITLGTATLSTSGKATLTTRAIPAGQNSTIPAIYSGDSEFATSSASTTVSVSQDSTTTTVVSSANPSSFGQSVTFTATVKAVAPGSGVPTGTVTFSDGSTSLGTATLNSSGKATFRTSALGVGSHTITASYVGDSNFTASATTTSLAQNVNQAATKTTVSSSANPSRFGQPVTFTAMVKAVTPGSGVPTGTVTFFDGSTSLGTAQLYGSGLATISISTLSVGPHTITAAYGGDGNFTLSTSAALTQTVKQAATKTTIISSANPSGPGQVSFTATVTPVAPGTGIPTGNVTFSINGTPQSPVSLTVINGVDEAAFTTTLSAAGTYTITAAYDGDINFTTSTSSVIHQKVK